MVIPVFYAEPQLGQTLDGVASLRDRLDLEILLVVDVPDARRLPEVQAVDDALARRAGARVLYRVGERGFGGALRHGFSMASGDVIIPMMADASERPEDVLRLVAAVRGGLDVAAGSRYMRGGRIVGNSMKQRISRLYSVLVRLVGGPPIHDVSNAFKAYRKEVLSAVESVAESFDVSVELTVKAARAGFRIGEVPTVWINRQAGASKFRFWREVRNYARWLLLAAGPGGRGARTWRGEGAAV